MGEGSHWSIYSFIGQHSCKDSESVRKRNYQHSQIDSTCIPLKGFVPNKRTQGGGAKQVIDIASKDGMAIGRGQAHSIVRTLRVDSVPVHIGQYWLLKSYFATLQDKDPGGTFKLEMETKKKDWNDWNPAPQFKRCYVAFSFTKHQWTVGSVRIIVTDGTFTKTGIFTHTILLAVTYDGNNELVLLAYAFCPKENTENWVWFLRLLKSDFPGIEILVADYDKGIQSAEYQAILFSIQAIFGRCLKHMVGNAALAARKNNKLRPNEEATVFKLCRARTEARYKIQLEALYNLKPFLADWFDSNKDLFASYRFIERSKPRFRIITSNAAEQMNSALIEERAEPIFDSICHIGDWQKKKTFERHEKAKKWIAEGKQLTGDAEKFKVATASEAQQRVVHVLDQSELVIKAEVSTSSDNLATEFLAVELDLSTFKITCPCLWTVETGKPCYHGAAVIIKTESEWNDPRWFHTIYHLSTYKRMYEKPVPVISTSGVLKSDPILPPEAIKQKGRPKTKRKESQSTKKRTCSACGEDGRFEKGCINPSTKRRFEHHRREVEKYVKSVEES